MFELLNVLVTWVDTLASSVGSVIEVLTYSVTVGSSSYSLLSLLLPSSFLILMSVVLVLWVIHG